MSVTSIHCRQDVLHRRRSRSTVIVGSDEEHKFFNLTIVEVHISSPHHPLCIATAHWHIQVFIDQILRCNKSFARAHQRSREAIKISPSGPQSCQSTPKTEGFCPQCSSAGGSGMFGGRESNTQHLLTFLADDSDKFECNACGGTVWGFIYHYSDSECQFNLDVVCTSLTMTTTKDYPSHPHPLIICDKNDKYSPVLCSTCDLPFEDLIYVCFECKCLLHESCTNFVEEIKHPYHLEHPFVLLPGPPSTTGMFGCNACKGCLPFSTIAPNVNLTWMFIALN